MAGKVDVLAVLGSSRLETAQFAEKAGVTLASARCALHKAAARGEVACNPADSSYWRRGACLPLIWSASRVK